VEPFSRCSTTEPSGKGKFLPVRFAIIASLSVQPIECKNRHFQDSGKNFVEQLLNKQTLHQIRQISIFYVFC